MTPITEIKSILDQIEQREKAASDPPWQNYYNRHTVQETVEPYPDIDVVGDICVCQTCEDGDFISHSRTDVPKLRKALRMAVAAIEGNEMNFILEQILTELKS